MAGTLAGYLFIFFARICDVSLSTIRMIMVVRGQRLYASAIGFFEVIIYVTALKLIFSNLNNPLNLLVYAAGFAMGNYIGSLIEEKLAVGTLTVQIITMISPLELTEKLRLNGYGVTVIEGHGREGVKEILQIILPRKRMTKLCKEIDEWDCNAFWTVFDARTTRGGIFSRKAK